MRRSELAVEEERHPTTLTTMKGGATMLTNTRIAPSSSPTLTTMIATFFGEDGWDVPYETHGGESVAMDGFGYKHFSAGDTDGDGNTVTGECTVFTWYVPFIDDDDQVWNHFQAVVYPDGRVQWNVRFVDGHFPKYSQYSGIYAGGKRNALYGGGRVRHDG